MKLALYVFYGSLSLIGAVAVLCYISNPDVRLLVRMMWGPQ